MGTFDIGQIATNASEGVVGQILGLVTGGAQDRRQLKQQKKLQNLQIKGQKELADYQQQKELDMWHQTNYGAQIEELKNAGLNPALLYGKGGGGGTTTGGGIATGVTSGTPTDPSAATGMGIQLGMMQAQKALIEAQTAKTKAETTKTEGVDTAESLSRIEQIKNSITNTQAQTALTETQNRLNKLEEFKQNETLQAWIEKAKAETDYQAYITRSALQKAKLDEATINDAITAIHEQSLGAGINNMLMRENIKLTKAQTNKIATDITQKWKELEQGDTKNAIETFKAEIQANYPNIMNTMGREIDQFIENIYNATGKTRNKPHTINK